MEITAEIIAEAGVMASLIAALMVIFIDAILGTALAIKKGEFDAAKLPQFLVSGILPYIIALVALAAGALLAPGFYAALFLAFFTYAIATVMTKYITDINNKIAGFKGVQNGDA